MKHILACATFFLYAQSIYTVLIDHNTRIPIIEHKNHIIRVDTKIHELYLLRSQLQLITYAYHTALEKTTTIDQSCSHIRARPALDVDTLKEIIQTCELYLFALEIFIHSIVQILEGCHYVYEFFYGDIVSIIEETQKLPRTMIAP